MRQEYDVIVVGMGPVGGAMALALAHEGLRVAVVEQFPDPFDKPRAIGIDHDSLRLLQSFGVMDQLGPSLGEYRPSEYLSARGELLRRILPQPKPYPQAWPPYSTFVQPELEKVLREACARNALIDLKLGWLAAQPAESRDGVEIDIAHVGTGGAQSLAAKYLVACDGARSPIRAALPLSLIDLEFDESWLVVDVIVTEDATLPQTTVQYCNAERPATFIEGPGRLRRWEIMLLAGEDPSEMSEETRVWQLLSPWLREDQGQIWRAACYRFNARVADRMQCGRIFLAGDAAHQTPPFMAQGLNQGIKDVINLAWKIAAVIHGSASADILETYSDERQPNAAAVIALTKQLGKIICELDPVGAADRDRVMLGEVAAGRGEVVRQDLLPPLQPGRLVREGALGKGAGKVFPQPLIAVGEAVHRLDDIVDRGFILFLDSAVEEPLLSAACAANIRIVCLGGEGDALREVEPVASDWLRSHGALAALVRPDHIVYGTATSGSEIGRLVEELTASLH